MATIQDVMHAAARQIYGKVEITYTDIFRDDTSSIEYEAPGRYTYPEQLRDTVLTPAQKYFSLHENKLDGSYHPLPGTAAGGQVGYWGTKMSLPSGGIAGTVFKVTFSSRSLSNIRIVGDRLLSNYPVNFVVKAFSPTNTLLITRTVTNNTQVEWVDAFDPVLNVATVEITVSKISQGNSVLKLLEISIATRETYEGDLLQDFRHLAEIGYVTGNLPMGNISSNEIDISILNKDRRFDLNNPQSPLYGYVKRNRQVIAWLGADVNGQREWYQLGKFWTSSWDIPKAGLFAQLTARDRLDLLRTTYYDKSQVFTDRTVYDLFDIILSDAAEYAEGYYIDPALKSIVIPYAWFNKMTHREALTKLSTVGIIQIYCDNKGDIQVTYNLPTTPTVQATYSGSSDIYDATYPMAVTEQVNSIEVGTNTIKQMPEGSIYTLVEPFSIPAGVEITKEFVFTQPTCYNISWPIFESDGDVLVRDVEIYCWGARMKLRGSSSTVTINSVNFTGNYLSVIPSGVALAQDEVLIREDGLLKATVYNEFIQSPTYAQALAAQVLDVFKASRFDITMSNNGNITVDLGDRIEVELGGEREQYSVTRQQLTFTGYLDANTEARKI